MSRKETILKAARRTAQEARAAASRRRDAPSSRQAESGVRSHRHCVVCWTPIPLDNGPPVCGGGDCATMQGGWGSWGRGLSFVGYV
ncbi:MAG: hypothetical protein QGG76_04860, partial [Candidatus Thalassarchaeaceae archaeon]|nr:hypothetical protein [Candidatus Thalassarchaeaceae archaeon]